MFHFTFHNFVHTMFYINLYYRCIKGSLENVDKIIPIKSHNVYNTVAYEENSDPQKDALSNYSSDSSETELRYTSNIYDEQPNIEEIRISPRSQYKTVRRIITGNNNPLYQNAINNGKKALPMKKKFLKIKKIGKAFIPQRMVKPGYIIVSNIRGVMPPSYNWKYNKNQVVKPGKIAFLINPKYTSNIPRLRNEVLDKYKNMNLPEETDQAAILNNIDINSNDHIYKNVSIINSMDDYLIKSGNMSNHSDDIPLYFTNSNTNKNENEGTIYNTPDIVNGFNNRTNSSYYNNLNEPIMNAYNLIMMDSPVKRNLKRVFDSVNSLNGGKFITENIMNPRNISDKRFPMQNNFLLLDGSDINMSNKAKNAVKQSINPFLNNISPLDDGKTTAHIMVAHNSSSGNFPMYNYPVDINGPKINTSVKAKDISKQSIRPFNDNISSINDIKIIRDNTMDAQKISDKIFSIKNNFMGKIDNDKKHFHVVISSGGNENLHMPWKHRKEAILADQFGKKNGSKMIVYRNSGVRDPYEIMMSRALEGIKELFEDKDYGLGDISDKFLRDFNDPAEVTGNVVKMDDILPKHNKNADSITEAIDNPNDYRNKKPVVYETDPNMNTSAPGVDKIFKNQEINPEIPVNEDLLGGRIVGDQYDAIGNPNYSSYESQRPPIKFPNQNTCPYQAEQTIAPLNPSGVNIRRLSNNYPQVAQNPDVHYQYDNYPPNVQCNPANYGNFYTYNNTFYDSCLLEDIPNGMPSVGDTLQSNDSDFNLKTN